MNHHYISFLIILDLLFLHVQTVRQYHLCNCVIDARKNLRGGGRLWHLTPLSTIIHYIVVVSFIGGEKRSSRENNHPIASHWPTLSHNVVSSTPRHERDSNFSGDRYSVRTKTSWLRIRIICPSGATCLLTDCCFSELAL